MTKVTSKLQVTIPKRIADEYGIEPGDEIEFVAAAETIRVIPPGRPPLRSAVALEERLHWFDAATERQRARERLPRRDPAASGVESERGWAREDLYERAGAG